MPVASCIECGSDFYYDEEDTFERWSDHALCVTCPYCMSTVRVEEYK